MLAPYAPKKILFLKGVFRADCRRVEDLFHDRLLQDFVTQEDAMYKKLPEVFQGLDVWPTTTHIWCRWHHRPFKTRPVFIPRSIEPCGASVIMDVDDCFCGFNCAQAFINKNARNAAERINKTNNLLYLYKIFNARTAQQIIPSPSPFLMKQYGGNLSEQEYANMVGQLETESKKAIQEQQFAALVDDYSRVLSADIITGAG